MSPPFDIRIVANHSPPDWWSIGLTSLAGIVGVLIGAGISYLVARQTANESRRVAKDNQRENEKLATYRIGLKLMELMNASAGYHLRAERSIAQVRKDVGDERAPAWLAMQPFIGRPIEITLLNDDLIIFWRAGALAFITRVMFLFNSYNAMIYAVEGYSIRREALMSKIMPETMNGLIGSIVLTNEQERALKPEMESVRDFADQTRQHMKEVHVEAIQVLADFKPLVRDYFNDPKFPVPGLAEAEVEPNLIHPFKN